jgi:hypothetical protein
MTTHLQLELALKRVQLQFCTSVPAWHFTRWLLLSQLKTERCTRMLGCVWNLMAHGDAREGKWRENWRMEWVASTLTLSRNVVYPALLTLMHTTRLPAVDWTDATADLNGLVRFGERRNLVSARVPSRFKRTIHLPLYLTVSNVVSEEARLFQFHLGDYE